jgi:hypothetical protein
MSFIRSPEIGMALIHKQLCPFLEIYCMGLRDTVVTVVRGQFFAFRQMAAWQSCMLSLAIGPEAVRQQAI